MNELTIVILDLVAVSVLAFALYFPRYGRRDIVVAIVGLNVGVMAVATAFAESSVSAGFGLGLFGVLSIIRLRSSELAQEEVAYYFAALALGILAGVSPDPEWLTPLLMGAIVAALLIADHPRLYASSRHQKMLLDRVYLDEAELIVVLEAMLGATVRRVKVIRVDTVKETTSVDVRYRL